MVYIYKCKSCGMSHHIPMTAEQYEILKRNPNEVFYILPQLSYCYKEMIQDGVCPDCGGTHLEVKQH